ncbi:P-II family nitrogen regulator [Vibrio sp. HN007]|uniref:P-II family nitrogen regulator n=1 Tax=Vibrio iocasae TaxID=3098914 RepID=UPI0035D51D1E
MINKVSAIFREQQLMQIEPMLSKEGVLRFTTFRIQGKGEFSRMIDHHYMESYCQLDIFIGDNYVQSIVEMLLEELNFTGENEGIISVIPVQCFFNANSHSSVPNLNFNNLK